jgi:hypothetical protein
LGVDEIDLIDGGIGQGAHRLREEGGKGLDAVHVEQRVIAGIALGHVAAQDFCKHCCAVADLQSALGKGPLGAVLVDRAKAGMGAPQRRQVFFTRCALRFVVLLDGDAAAAQASAGHLAQLLRLWDAEVIKRGRARRWYPRIPRRSPRQHRSYIAMWRSTHWHIGLMGTASHAAAPA